MAIVEKEPVAQPSPGRVVRKGSFARLSEVGTAVRVLSDHKVPLDNFGLDPLQPTIYRLPDATAVPWDWAFMTRDGRMVVDGITRYPFKLAGIHLRGVKPQAATFTIQHGDIEFVPAPCFFVGGELQNNYYHWLIDYLPRLIAWRDTPGMSAMKIAIGGVLPAYMQAAITRLGIASERIIPIDAKYPTHFGDAYVPSAYSSYGAIHPLAIESVQALLGPQRSGSRPSESAPDRIFISRGDARKRRILNEAAVAERFERRGFTKVSLEGMSLEAQITLFSQARIIAGPHGAGLTNMIWAPRGAQILEFHAPVPSMTHFKLLAQGLGHRHDTLLGTLAPGAGPEDRDADYSLDIAVIDRALAHT